MQQTLKQLEDLYKAGKLPHGLLLVSDSKEELLGAAQNFARKTLKAERLDTHPDFINIDSNKVEDIRRLVSALSLRSFGQRVVVINNTEFLTSEAVNSLLKNIEEPKDGTLFILLATHEERILPTLRSRLMVFRDADSRTKFDSELASKFLQAENTAERLLLADNIDTEKNDLMVFLEKLYRHESADIKHQSGQRLEAVLKTYKLLNANVKPDKALSWLAVKWSS